MCVRPIIGLPGRARVFGSDDGPSDRSTGRVWVKVAWRSFQCHRRRRHVLPSSVTLARPLAADSSADSSADYSADSSADYSRGTPAITRYTTTSCLLYGTDRRRLINSATLIIHCDVMILIYDYVTHDFFSVPISFTHITVAYRSNGICGGDRHVRRSYRAVFRNLPLGGRLVTKY